MAAAVTFQLFAKSPVPGSVKTRLIPALDARDAATLHARMVEHAARAVALARAAIPGADAELWCSPDTTDPVLRAIADRHTLRLRRQPSGDLGARMREALESALPGRAILLGSDCPALDARTLIAADRALLAHDAVFVPVDDGGYALIGCRDAVPPCLDGMAWSTGDVMTADPRPTGRGGRPLGGTPLRVGCRYRSRSGAACRRCALHLSGRGTAHPRRRRNTTTYRADSIIRPCPARFSFCFPRRGTTRRCRPWATSSSLCSRASTSSGFPRTRTCCGSMPAST
ncbi:MAG: TIGR04282 family arsenosugar biosynthesis glycosyltransferase [Betaproteobacteria bacterium]|nr:TIGR04282 family arsenosugar biosynthesis glycosyltransferase [Betaproteobacteria bacterium]